ncbi:MAG: trypsin-like peptidase domain-containing protein [Candidatus Doudnabacteria bacterium]|nr:trypsin-like peptidase domain-containing protein [Candidatus Doudnabacteria bacterium]
MKSNRIAKFLAPVAIGGFLAFSTQVVGQNVKLNPIKPTSSKPTTDEQQAILAVRKAKSSVVNILGVNKVENTPTIKFESTEVSGTGFILSADGYIVTNQHVINEPEGKYTVMFADGKTYDARVVGTDKYNDIGLIKIETTGLVPAALADSSGLETGQTVFAIGNTLGKYQNTVTRGVVSGLSRAVNVGTESNPKPRLQNLIQTDASINPGNSGGPLVNMAGEVVGMNTLIDATAQGIGFAVPVNTIKTSVEQLKTLGKVSRPYLGLSFVGLTKTIQTENNLPTDKGAVVLKVEVGSPSALAGIKVNDIVTHLNKKEINQVNQLDTEVLRYEAGNQILVTILRNGEKMDLPLILGEYK